MIEWWVIVINLWARDFVSTDMWMYEDQCKAVIEKRLPKGVKAECVRTFQPWQQEM